MADARRAVGVGGGAAGMTTYVVTELAQLVPAVWWLTAAVWLGLIGVRGRRLGRQGAGRAAAIGWAEAAGLVALLLDRGTHLVANLRGPRLPNLAEDILDAALAAFLTVWFGPLAIAWCGTAAAVAAGARPRVRWAAAAGTPLAAAVLLCVWLRVAGADGAGPPRPPVQTWAGPFLLVFVFGQVAAPHAVLLSAPGWRSVGAAGLLAVILNCALDLWPQDRPAEYWETPAGQAFLLFGWPTVLTGCAAARGIYTLRLRRAWREADVAGSPP